MGGAIGIRARFFILVSGSEHARLSASVYGQTAMLLIWADLDQFSEKIPSNWAGSFLQYEGRAV
jgi:hypothetical protein